MIGKKIQNITFLGYADAKEKDELYKSTFAVAKTCAQHGYTIVNGGGPGLMKASTMGAKSVGGKAIGITFEPKDIQLFEGHDNTNKVDKLIICENYLERTLKLLQTGDVHIIFNGGTGTISEFGMAWGLAKLHFGHHKPLILFGNFWQEIIFALTNNMYIRSEERKVFKIVNNDQQVIEAIKTFQEEIDSHKHNHKNPIFSI